MTYNNEFIDTLRYFQSGHKQSDAKEKCGMRQAFAEVFILLEHFDNSIKRLIPKSFVMYLYDNMDTAWHGRIDFTKKLNDMELLKETRVLLSLIFKKGFNFKKVKKIFDEDAETPEDDTPDEAPETEDASDDTISEEVPDEEPSPQDDESSDDSDEEKEPPIVEPTEPDEQEVAENCKL